MSFSVLAELKGWFDATPSRLVDRVACAKQFIHEFGELAHMRAGAVAAEYYVEKNEEMFRIWKEITAHVKTLMDEGWLSSRLIN